MYHQSFDAFGYHPYNDPQPDHYTSSVSAGVPYPAPPASLEQYPPAEHPLQPYATFQDQHYNNATSYQTQLDQPGVSSQQEHYSQPYGSQSYVSGTNHYPTNPTLSTSHQSFPSLSHSHPNHYPLVAQPQSSFYPLVSSPSSEHYTPDPFSNPTESYTEPTESYGYSRPSSYSTAGATSWPASYGSKPNSTHLPAPSHGSSDFDPNHPNPYVQTPSAAVQRPRRPNGIQEAHHESTGTHTPTHPLNAVRPEWSDTVVLGAEREKLRQNEQQKLGAFAMPKQENVRFSVEEAQLIMKELKETNNNLNKQLKNSRDSTMKLLQERDTLKGSVEQLWIETNELKTRQNSPIQPIDHTEAIAAVEREWTQKLSLKEQEREELLAQASRHSGFLVRMEREWTQKYLLKEQENQQLLARALQHAEAIKDLEQAWTEKLVMKEQENTEVLARLSKSESEGEVGRIFLLEDVANKEAELVNQEGELMKLRQETVQLLDEVSQLVDERDDAKTLIERLEVEKQELEDVLSQSKGSGPEFLEREKASAWELQQFTDKVAALEKELKKYQESDEMSRLRVEELGNGNLSRSCLKSDLELESTTHNENQEFVSGMEDKLKRALEELEDVRSAHDSLEQQLYESEQREMERNLLSAGETRASKEELESLRYQLTTHLAAKEDTQKWALELDSEKQELEARSAELNLENRQMRDKIFKLEKELQDVKVERESLQENAEVVQDACDRDAREAEKENRKSRLRIEELETQISLLSSSKSDLETRAVKLESQKEELESTLQVTVENFKATREELECLKEEMDSYLAAGAKRDEWIQELEVEKARLEEHLANFKGVSDRLSGLEKRLTDMTKERDLHMREVQKLEKEKSAHLKEKIRFEAQGEILLKTQEDVIDMETEMEKNWEELQDMKVAKSDAEKRLQKEIDQIAKIMEAKSRVQQRVSDLEKERAELEEKIVVIIKDRAAANSTANFVGTQVSQLEAEIKDLKDRFSNMSLQYAEVQNERDELIMTNRHLRSSHK